MKRILALMLAVLMLTALVSCKNENVEDEVDFINPDSPEVETPAEDSLETDAPAEDEAPEEIPDPTPEVKDEVKPEAKPENKPASKPADKVETKPEVKPEEKPAEPTEKPAETPEVTPEVPEEEKPAETPSGKTTGDIMLSVFRANRDKSLDDIANACISHESIQFFPMTMPVEDSFFAEFDGDVTGFDKCVKFGPAMGSIAFSGMIFEVSGDAEAFAKELKSRANPRWNICVEADQTVCEVYGNRVFFLMCPKTLGE